MEKSRISQMLQGIDESFLQESLEFSLKPVKKKRKLGKKLLILVAAIITVGSLVGYHRGYPFQYFVGGYVARVMETVSPEGYRESSSSLSFDWDAEKPYRVEDGQIYFTHDGSDRNITEFCSVDDCFLYNNVNFWGNGHIVVVGGTAEHTADYIAFFQGGHHTSSVFSTTVDMERDDYYSHGSVIYKLHQWKAAIQYEINIRDEWYLNYYSEEDKWTYVDSLKPYNPYKITVVKP